MEAIRRERQLLAEGRATLKNRTARAAFALRAKGLSERAIGEATGLRQVQVQRILAGPEPTSNPFPPEPPEPESTPTQPPTTSDEPSVTVTERGECVADVFDSDSATNACSVPSAHCSDPEQRDSMRARIERIIAHNDAEREEERIVARLFDWRRHDPECPPGSGRRPRPPVILERPLSTELSAALILQLVRGLRVMSPEGAEVIERIATDVARDAHLGKNLPADTAEKSQGRHRTDHERALEALRHVGKVQMSGGKEVPVNPRAEDAYILREHLSRIARGFAGMIQPRERDAPAVDIAAWRGLSSEEKCAQIEATRAWYHEATYDVRKEPERFETDRAKAALLIDQPEYRLVRACFWHDGDVTGYDLPGVRVVLDQLRLAEEMARSGKWASTLAHISSVRLRRWITRLARGEQKQFGRGHKPTRRLRPQKKPVETKEVASWTLEVFPGWSLGSQAADKQIGKARRGREQHYLSWNATSSERHNVERNTFSSPCSDELDTRHQESSAGASAGSSESTGFSSSQRHSA